MKRIRNIALAAATAVIVFSAIVYNVANLVAPDVVEIPPYSDIEARYYATFPDLKPDAVLDKTYQDSLDAFLSDHVPLRTAAALSNAALQRAGIAASAALFGYDVYPTYLDSHYYVVPRDGIIVDRAEQAPADGGGNALDAWVRTLNEAAANHPDVRFVYDCVARHNQTEANPTYRFFSDRLNSEWAQKNLVDRLDGRISAFVDPVESYDEILDEWVATEEHWTLKRALKSYNQVAERLSLKQYDYVDPVEVVGHWYGDYARSGLDLDIPTNLEDMPIDFSNLTFYELGDVGGAEKQMGMRDDVLAGRATIEPGGVAQYYGYFGGGNTEALNSGENNGKTLLFVGDSLSYCLSRYLAANYEHAVFILPGNSRMDGTFEDYIEQYGPDDVIVMTHVTKYEMFAEYSPEFMGLDGGA